MTRTWLWNSVYNALEEARRYQYLLLNPGVLLVVRRPSLRAEEHQEVERPRRWGDGQGSRDGGFRDDSSHGRGFWNGGDGGFDDGGCGRGVEPLPLHSSPDTCISGRGLGEAVGENLACCSKHCNIGFVFRFSGVAR